MICLKNNAQSILAQSLERTDTTLHVLTGNGDIFPTIPLEGSDWFRCALSDNAGNTEYIKVVARRDDTFEVERAQEESLAREWPAGTRIQLRMTAQSWAEMAGQEWHRLMAEDGDMALPEKVSERVFTLRGNFFEDFNPRRAVRFPGEYGVFHVESRDFTDGMTIITTQSGVLPDNMPSVECGIAPSMLPAGHALCDDVDREDSLLGASAWAVKKAWDKAAENTQAIAGLADKSTALDGAVEEIRGQVQAFQPFHKGMIIIWSGNAANIPDGWALCDGENETPDLRDRFVVGAGGAYTYGEIGGQFEHSHTVNIDPTTLTTTQIPSHTHARGDQTRKTVSNASSFPVYTSQAVAGLGTTAYVGNTGGNGSHTHSASTEESNMLPPYYAMCYLMFLGS